MKRIITAFFAIASFIVSYQIEFLDIKDLEKGMKGYCTTVFSGTKVDTFDVEVIDIIFDKESSVEMALVKCIGENVENTGIAQGMSGSPVYFNNKLFGSMSYTWDNLREPIGGVVPIKRMLELENYQKNVNLSEGYKLKEIAVPIVMTGVKEDVLEMIKEKNPILKYAVAGSGSGFDKSGGELLPGKGIAIKLIDGEMSASAIGTVTYVEENKVFSLGHPFTQKGDIEYPVSEAYIYMVLPRTDISYKMGYAMSAPLGSAVQDRTYGVLSYSDRKADMTDVSIIINNGERINLKFAKDDEILASYLPLMFISAVSKYYKTAGSLTADYKMTVFSKNKKKTEYSNMVTGENVFFAVYFDLQSILYAYLSNMYEKVPVDSVIIESEVTENINQYYIRDMQIEKKYYEPGETVRGKILLKTFKGEDAYQEFAFVLPHGMQQDSFILYAGGGRNDFMYEASRSEAKFQYENLKTFEDILKNMNPANSIVIKLYGKRKGFIDNNKEYFNMPQSFINKQILTGKKMIMSDVLYKEMLKINGVVDGECTAVLKIRRPQ